MNQQHKHSFTIVWKDISSGQGMAIHSVVAIDAVEAIAKSKGRIEKMYGTVPDNWMVAELHIVEGEVVS